MSVANTRIPKACTHVHKLAVTGHAPHLYSYALGFISSSNFTDRDLCLYLNETSEAASIHIECHVLDAARRCSVAFRVWSHCMSRAGCYDILQPFRQWLTSCFVLCLVCVGKPTTGALSHRVPCGLTAIPCAMSTMKRCEGACVKLASVVTCLGQDEWLLLCACGG